MHTGTHFFNVAQILKYAHQLSVFRIRPSSEEFFFCTKISQPTVRCDFQPVRIHLKNRRIAIRVIIMNNCVNNGFTQSSFIYHRRINTFSTGYLRKVFIFYIQLFKNRFRCLNNGIVSVFFSFNQLTFIKRSIFPEFNGNRIFISA